MKTSVKLPRVLFSDTTEKVFPLVRVTPRLLGPLVKFTVPLGLTVKLTDPPLCLENENGFGDVVTWTVHGVGDGLGLGDGDGDTLGDGEGLGVGDGLGVGVGDGLGVGVGLGLAAGDGVGVGEFSPTGVGVGVGLLLPLVVEPPSMPVRPLTFTFTLGTSSR